MIERNKNDVSKQPLIKIKDSTSNENKSGYVSLPDRIPISLFIGWIIQFVVLIVGGTSMYHNIKSNQEYLQKQVTALETKIEKDMYTRQEASNSKELAKMEIEKLRIEIAKHTGH